MRRVGPIIAASTTGFLTLVGLGVWQLQRLHWKEGIIAQIKSRRNAAATSMPTENVWSSLQPDDYEYKHVAVNGAFDADKTALVFRGGAPNAPGEGPGYELLTPLRLPDDSVVIVNRGFAPLASIDAARANLPKGTVVLTGLMRSPETRNAFTPSDEPSRSVWYTRDPASVAARFALKRVAPFSIDADANPKAQGWPRAGTTVVDIPNNHLSYALTWFGLAAALIGVSIAYLKSRSHPASRPAGGRP